MQSMKIKNTVYILHNPCVEFLGHK